MQTTKPRQSKEIQPIFDLLDDEQPFTRQTQVILGSFGLLFLLCKLLIVPLVQIVHISYHEFRAKNQICITKKW
ncbi:unnamed protein product [Adineta ricciae]|uniref:Uncharacterized protein n=1 Tax=Adineta ricciae TaxID=249248 RepID=A0A815QVR4_ADIRI|nr:unnamed protein product [Adineta ricciae]